MLMTRKNITDFEIARDFLASVAGEKAVEITRLCSNKTIGVSDEYLAKKTGLKITEVRAILNKLHYQGIAVYSKTKDAKSGWYYYCWGIKEDRIAELVSGKQQGDMEKLKIGQFLNETYDFFSCINECGEMAFEIAAEYNFKCPKCGKTLDALDGQKRLKKISKKISSIAEEMDGLAVLAAKKKEQKTQNVGQIKNLKKEVKKAIKSKISSRQQFSAKKGKIKMKNAIKSKKR